jgi:protein TonB
MQAASYRARFQGQSERRRVASFVLTLLAHALLLWLLLRLGPAVMAPPPPQAPLSTFSVLPDPTAVASRAKTTRVTKATPTLGGAAPRPRTTTTTAQPVTPPTPPFPAMLPGGSQLFETADISKIPSAKSGEGEGDGEGSAKGAGRDSVAAYGPGEGPGGQRLYNAEWQREPTSAQLNGYLTSPPPPDSWAEIACRTIPDFQVDNCRILGESPVGSGLARQMRLAAWQFRVLPPRRGGQKLIGAWVRIHISWNGRKAE